ncbi:MAG TPA: NADP-dependent oxidoreductase [Polyangia bacterium]|jgi:NADPH:quinone reductase-like Zn-dependent oxidoreductase
MKAVVLPEYGEANRLEVRDLPEPTPGPNEIKVRVAAAGINPIDWKLRSGAFKAYRPLTFPAVLGRDVSGEVVAVGPGVIAFKVGTRVLGFVDHGYAAFVVAPVDAWAEVPAGLELIDAAALPLVSLTGAQLVEAAGIREGDAVLVTGATGAVGRVAVFIARSRGAKVFAGVRRNHKADAATLGADVVVALDDEQEIAKLPPLDALADTVGGATTQQLLGKLKAGGRIGSVVGEPAGAKERGFAVQAFSTHRDPKRLAELAASAAAGKLIVPLAKRFPFSQAGAAHALAEKGGVGKVLLLPDR